VTAGGGDFVSLRSATYEPIPAATSAASIAGISHPILGSRAHVLGRKVSILLLISPTSYRCGLDATRGNARGR